MPNLEIDGEFLIRTLEDLVRIDSVNPLLTPGGQGEARIASHMCQVLQRIGLEPALLEPEPGRASAVGRLTGRAGGRSLMLNGHLDTVGLEGGLADLNPVLRQGRMYGRGTYDMKGGLAACLAAAKAIVDSGSTLQGNLLIATVADEEYASLGTADLLPRYRVDGAVVAEATGLDICVAHKGFAWLEVVVRGRAAHGSNYAEGIDANMMMGRFLAKLELLDRELRSRQGHPLTGPPSLHAPKIQGGKELSVYAEQCTLQIERRLIPGESDAQVVQEVQAVIDKLTEKDPKFQASVRSFFGRQPFETPPDTPIVQAVQQAAVETLGRAPRLVGSAMWMDSALLCAAGIPTVVIGPLGAGAHGREEWVDLQSLLDLAAILARTALLYCS